MLMVYRISLHVCAISSGLSMKLKIYVHVYRFFCECVWGWLCVWEGGGATDNQQVNTGEDVQITLSEYLESMYIYCLRSLVYTKCFRYFITLNTKRHTECSSTEITFWCFHKAFFIHYKLKSSAYHLDT